MMKRSFLMSTATAALIACAGYAIAQTSGGSQAPGGSSQAPQAAPSQSGGSMGQGSPGSDTKGGADMKRMPAGSAETKGDAGSRSSTGAEMKGGSDTRHGASESGKSDRKGTAEQQRQDRNAQQRGQSTEQQGQSTEQRGQSTDQRNQTTQQNTGTGGSASANLSTEQQTRIRTVIKERSDVKAVTNVNFDISINAHVPRTVHLYSLPPAVVEVHPAWRGYQFILVRDEIVVINPRTMLIIAVIPA